MPEHPFETIAQQFGNSLDQDDFEATQKLLSKDCKYHIGSKVLSGPIDICNSYEQNMIEGRKKLDQLVWGKSKIEPINEFEFFVHFTDHLTHKGITYTHRCKQKLLINHNGQISQIIHVGDPEEQERLNDYYSSVGINSNK